MERLQSYCCFSGSQELWQHRSSVLDCTMSFGVYLPSSAASVSCPVVYWLSGLTCTEENFVTKAGAQRYAEEHGVIVVAPDTSPRGESVPDDEAYDLGQGAGFYLNATCEPWARHYQMYDYILNELPALIDAHFPSNTRRSIFGHSMGGHGALILALKNPGVFQSVSAFAPIVTPSAVPWGQKALSEYLGEERNTWAAWDTCALIESAGERLPILVDQGLSDPFLKTQLQPEALREICTEYKHPLELRLQPGYDHSYYFIASFIGDHIAHHARALLG